MLMTTSPYWPLPPVWRTNLPCDLVGLLADRLAVGDLRLADGGLDAELAHHPVDEHLEVELAHSVDHGLPGLLVALDAEGRVLLGEALKRGRQLLLVDLGLRLDRDGDHGLREDDLLERDRRVGGAEGVARRGLLEADPGEDVARVALVDLLAGVGMHHQQPADPLGPAGGDVEHPAAGAELAGVDAEIGELADEGVGHDLEGERRERGVVVGRPGRRVALGVALDRLDAGYGVDLQRRRQQRDDRVEQRLHALVLEGRAAEDRGHREVERRLLERRPDPIFGDLLLLQVHLHELVVDVGAGLDHRRREPRRPRPPSRRGRR